LLTRGSVPTVFESLQARSCHHKLLEPAGIAEQPKQPQTDKLKLKPKKQQTVYNYRVELRKDKPANLLLLSWLSDETMLVDQEFVSKQQILNTEKDGVKKCTFQPLQNV
jgi:hypothetical protein